MDLTGLSSIFDLGKDLIDKLIPDPQAKAAAQLQLLTLQQQGEFKEIDANLEAMKTSTSAINTEGASADKWTSRARPAFLYVIYTVILFGLRIVPTPHTPGRGSPSAPSGSGHRAWNVVGLGCYFVWRQAGALRARPS